MFEKTQSGFLAHHSTESTLLRVTSDRLVAADGAHSLMLILLDLSAAFNTVGHAVLIDRLHH